MNVIEIIVVKKFIKIKPVNTFPEEIEHVINLNVLIKNALNKIFVIPMECCKSYNNGFIFIIKLQYLKICEM